MQLVNHHKVTKSAAQSGEIERPTAAIHSDSEFGKGERHFVNRSQESEEKTRRLLIPDF
jgi:hypothetical protein